MSIVQFYWFGAPGGAFLFRYGTYSIGMLCSKSTVADAKSAAIVKMPMKFFLIFVIHLFLPVYCFQFKVSK